MAREQQEGMAFLPAQAEDLAPHVQDSGIVSAGPNSAAWLADLACRMRTDGASSAFAVPDMLAVETRMARCLASQDEPWEAAWRGLLALALLWNSHDQAADGPRLAVVEMDGASPMAGAALAAIEPSRRAEGLLVLALTAPDGQRVALGLVNRRTILAPAAASGDLSPWLPEWAAWYDRAQHRFADPCAYLGETDRARFEGRLRLLKRLHTEAALASTLYDEHACLAAPLERFLAALSRQAEVERQAIAGAEKVVLALRLKAVCGLLPETDFPHLVCREERCGGAAEDDPLLRCFLKAGLAPEDAAAPLRRTYLWRGVPFARESDALGLESAHHPDEDDALAEIQAEVALLEANSPRWQRDLAGRLDAWLQSRRDALLPEARRVAEDVQQRALDEARAPREEVCLTWPWRRDSGAVRLLLQEALGTSWAEDAMAPFADGLAVLTDCDGDTLGDAVLRQSCRIRFAAEGLPPCAAVPPLSAALAHALAGGGGVSLLTDSLDFTHRALPEGGEEIEAAFTLLGAQRVRFCRAYQEAEVHALAPEETPTVAVWPCIPFAPGRWTRYYVYAHPAGGVTAEALSHGRWTAGEERRRDAGDGEAAWTVQATEVYPAYLMLRQGDACLGAVPNLLPPFVPPVGESAVIAMDLGATGTAVMLRQGGHVLPMEGPTLVRTLLKGSCAPLAEEFLPPTSIQPIIPSAACVFADAPEDGCRPLVDGHIHQPGASAENGEAGTLFYNLPWGTEPACDRARRIYLAQVMETACLAAVTHGAADVSWRVALPDAMAAEGRRSFCRMMNDLAQETAQATSVPLTPGVMPVGFALKSVAAGAYFHAREEMNLRGGFLMLDVGSGSAELALWLRGAARPVAGCTLPMGAQMMLLDTLLAEPQALSADLTGLENADACVALEQLTGQLTLSRGSLRALQRSRMLLDVLLGEHLEAISRFMNEAAARGQCTLTQALLLLHFAFLLMQAGQLLEQAYLDATMNDRLPRRMEVCLAGRGARLMLAMDEARRRRLAGFLGLAMSASHPARELTLIASPAPKLEVSVGLLRMAEVEAQAPEDARHGKAGELSMTPADTLARFLLRFHAEFPDASAHLMGDWFDEAGRLTLRMQQRLQDVVAKGFGGEGTLQAHYAACFAALREDMTR